MKSVGLSSWRIAYNVALFIAFVVVYLRQDIFAATIVVMAGVAGEIMVTATLGQKVDRLQWSGLAIVAALGSATLLLRDDTFIKLRPTAVYWLIAATFSIALVAHKNPIELIVRRWFDAPSELWIRLTKLWVAILTVIGALNLAIAFSVSTDIWVLWRVFGAPGLIVVLITAQVVRYRRFLTRARADSPLS